MDKYVSEVGTEAEARVEAKAGAGAETFQSRIAQTASLLQERARLARLAGLSFGGKRDLYKVFGYPEVVDQYDLWSAFSRQNIARRIVVAPAAASWVKAPRVLFEVSGVQRQWDRLIKNKRLNIWFQLARLDVLCGMGDFAILFISMGDKDPSVRARKVLRQRDPLYVTPYAQMSVSIIQYDGDISSENYAKPLMYQVNPHNSFQRGQAFQGSVAPLNPGANNTPIRIHYTRVVHAAEEAFDNDTFGASRLRAVYNDLLDVLKVVGGAAETFWIAGNRGLQINIDKDLELRAGDVDNLQSEVDEYIHELSRVIRTRGTEVKALGSDTPDPSAAFSALIALICGATTIPRRILMGSEAGHLASEQDRANWADRIRERNELFVKPRILYPFILRLQDMGILGDSEFEVDWPDPFTLSPIERSQAFSNFMRGLSSVSQMMESGAVFVTREEAREWAGLGIKPEPGMGELPEMDMNMFIPQENIQTNRQRNRNRSDSNSGTNSEDTTSNDRDDVASEGQNPQTQRS